ncbi:MAG: M23 family metallopeptidase [Treponema sp.]|nr:M23 family metallopeptidase [Treponema sp.]
MKKIFSVLAVVFAAACVFAVEWPQAEHGTDSISSYFGQNIDGRISQSIIFEEPAQVNSIKDGKILIIISDFDDDSSFFPSALGTSVIVAHDDDLISVYGNLDKESVKQNVLKKDSLKEGDVIGETGNTGWQKKRSSLEFQIIDSQKKTSINPKILLPRVDNVKDYTLSGLILRNKDGAFFDLRESRVFPSGSYRIYHTRNQIAVPYKMTATINGVVVDELSFDTIGMQGGKLYISGKKQYTAQDIYPREDLILCGDFMLTPGKSTLAINTENILGKTRQVSYVISIY